MKFRIVNVLIWLALVTFSMYAAIKGWNLWPLAVAAILYPILLITVSANIRWNFFLKGYHHNTAATNKICITFDDGPSDYTLQILDILDKYNAKACFFCIGQHMEKHPEIVKEIYKRGHVIGNHTYSHTRKMGFLSSKTLVREIEACDIVAYDLLQLKLNFFRPPFGIINPNTKKAIEKTGHHVIGWNLRTYDAIINDKEKIVVKIKRRLQAGDVVLLHDNKQQTLAILEQLLMIVEAKHYQAISPDKLFNINAYN
ncbi:polysaccharide deacetylase family protein [Zunongwangia sp.]|uniref:polysaccharide deacetylase family protein n=1 Tax=Zunongwangia sp. TaxID=1965325 RepID=UPI003AA9BD2C